MGRTVKRIRKTGRTDVMPERKLKIVYVPLTDLKLWDRNPRKTDAAAKKLAKLIKMHGVNSPLVCTRDNVIRKGNTTYKALEILGEEEAPVVYIEFPSEQQAALYSISDNRAGEFSEWDPGLLAELLGEKTAIPPEELGYLTGFSEPDILGLRDIYNIDLMQEDAKPTGTPKAGTFVFFRTPSDADSLRVMERFGRADSENELDYGKVVDALNIRRGAEYCFG